ncbi:CAP domain-containing protein [Blautia sp.]|uniref:CAP domain-containing protein n=1 Tax=Blautia sp. TaxID=1955243 RepID=UPI00258F3C64|nr:CAP domain-containing protein [Blautia sp.]
MKRKRISFLAMLILAVILLMPASIQAATKPGAVKLTKITAVDYNKISIKWKKASGITNYIVYYKGAGNSKWIKLKTLGNTKSSYTHTSSSKYPIVVGQKYQYTVKAYDKNTKKYGSYNTKGLTVTASLKMVTRIQAKIEGTTVKLTWNKVSGADKYAIYSKIKAGDKWSKIITVKDTSSFIDVNPCVDCTNYYSVRGYSSITKTYGVMNKTGVSIYVKDSDEVKPTITPEPTDTPDSDDEIDHATPEQKAQEVFKLVNTERMKVGLQPYKYDLRLEKAAMVRAKEIAVKFSHTRPDGRDSYSAVYEAGVGCPSGENIGMGTTSAEYMVTLWMNSTGHQAAILSRSTTHIGVGYYLGHWVQLFSYGPDEKCVFTIDANGGIFEDGASVKSFQFPLKQSHISIYDTFPTPIREGYKFDGWILHNKKFHYITAYGDDTFTATWIPNN